MVPSMWALIIGTAVIAVLMVCDIAKDVRGR